MIMKKEEMKNWEILEIPAQNEEGMLEQMGVHIDIAAENDNDIYENAALDNSEYEPSFIYIVVNDYIHKFILGGPQMAGLEAFIETISDENGYDLR